MKKVILLAILVALVLMGCCTKTAVDGTVTKSFSNCLTVAQEIACNPPDSVILVAESSIPIIEFAIASLVPGSAEWMMAVTAGATAHTIVTSLQTGVCVSITQLNGLIAFLQSPYAKTAQTKMASKGMKAATVAIDVTPLQHWLASKQ